jgi:L-ascorbate metabolism protein UlaG (beta-lactamase superfamily)
VRPFGRLVVFLATVVVLPGLSADTIPAAGGDIEITPILHAAVQLRHAGKVIYVDPVLSFGSGGAGVRGDYSHATQADLILVTAGGDDHLDVEAIRKIRKVDAPVVIPADAKTKVPDGTVLVNGETKTVAGVIIEAVASYDVTPGAPAHPKGLANGYIVTLGGKRVLFAGVTECVPEIKALQNIDVAFLPMNLPKKMMLAPAVADCVRALKPKVVYPYHYLRGNIQGLKDALKGESVDVRLVDLYPASTVVVR